MTTICPTCQTQHSEAVCPICSALERVRILARERQRDYAQAKAGGRNAVPVVRPAFSHAERSQPPEQP